MGSFIEINDTLQISKEQGFPNELEINKHLESPYTLGGGKRQNFQILQQIWYQILSSAACQSFPSRKHKW
jgi:hypothetical protein